MIIQLLVKHRRRLVELDIGQQAVIRIESNDIRLVGQPEVKIVLFAVDNNFAVNQLVFYNKTNFRHEMKQHYLLGNLMCLLD